MQQFTTVGLPCTYITRSEGVHHTKRRGTVRFTSLRVLIQVSSFGRLSRAKLRIRRIPSRERRLSEWYVRTYVCGVGFERRRFRTTS